MPKIKITNLTAAAMGLYAVDGSYNVAAAMGGQTELVPDITSLDVIETLTAGGAVNLASVKYSVVYHANGADDGNAPVDTDWYAEDGEVTVKANTGTLSLAGHKFDGWNTQADGSGDDYDGTGTDTFTMGKADVDLFAVWTAVYTVTYNDNGSTSGTAPVDASSPYEVGDTVTVAAKGNLAKTGETFICWNTASDRSGTSYAASATFEMTDKNVTLYAIWAATFTVTYHANGADDGDAPVDTDWYEEDAEVTVKANTGTLALAGHKFDGWNTQADGSGDDYDGTGTDTFTMGKADVTLYAIWVADEG